MDIIAEIGNLEGKYHAGELSPAQVAGRASAKPTAQQNLTVLLKR